MNENTKNVNEQKKTENTDEFKDRLKKSRINAGFTSQENFAKALGVSKASISYYEKGTRKPDIDTFIMIADALNVSYDYLLGYSNTPTREYYEISKLTGLSDKAIETLKKLAVEVNKDTEEFNYFNQICKREHYMLNYLLENDLKYYLFNALKNYLCFKEDNKELIKQKQPVINDDFGFTMTIKQWENSFKIALDEKLFNIKDDIEKEAKTHTSNNKNS